MRENITRDDILNDYKLSYVSYPSRSDYNDLVDLVAHMMERIERLEFVLWGKENT